MILPDVSTAAHGYTEASAFALALVGYSVIQFFGSKTGPPLVNRLTDELNN